MPLYTRLDAYVGRQILTSTLIAMISLASLVLVTQSIRLLDLVLQSGAGAVAYLWILALSMPRLMEVVLPASFFVALLFVYKRLQNDSELTVMRSIGFSNTRLIKPALLVCSLMVLLLLAISLWVGPKSVARLERTRADVATQYARFLFREGVFNSVGNGLTAYVRKQLPDGRLEGLLVHDTREAAKPVTILARRGQIVTTPTSQSILVFDGKRQVLDKTTGKLATLSFSRYTIDVPSPEANLQRWKEPEERTLPELFTPLPTDDETQRKQLNHEIHRRLSAPFMLLSFALLAGCFMLLPAFTRQHKAWPLIAGGITALAVQAAYYTLSQTVTLSGAMVMLPYVFAATPAAVCFALVYFSDRAGEA